MKKSEIKVGRTFTDGKGNIREVTNLGYYPLYKDQQDTHCVQYKVLTKKRGPHPVGSSQCCTQSAFAAWAKGMISEAT